MAKAARHNFDATNPMHGWVGAADLAVDKLRQVAAELQERDPKELVAQARTRATELLDELVGESKKAQLRLERLSEQLSAQLSGLTVRGQAIVAKLRDDSISGDVEIIDPDAEVVKDVSPVVEKAAAEAAKQAQATKKPSA